jgi:hypothetical protein
LRVHHSRFAGVRGGSPLPCELGAGEGTSEAACVVALSNAASFVEVGTAAMASAIWTMSGVSDRLRWGGSWGFCWGRTGGAASPLAAERRPRVRPMPLPPRRNPRRLGEHTVVETVPKGRSAAVAGRNEPPSVGRVVSPPSFTAATSVGPTVGPEAADRYLLKASSGARAWCRAELGVTRTAGALHPPRMRRPSASRTAASAWFCPLVLNSIV